MVMLGHAFVISITATVTETEAFIKAIKAMKC